ncbi:MAG: hypothetical protein K0S39_2943 [Paenibacillus sp.]|nr:hypothetical protein [Paenibacillus sp.]
MNPALLDKRQFVFKKSTFQHREGCKMEKKEGQSLGENLNEQRTSNLSARFEAEKASCLACDQKWTFGTTSYTGSKSIPPSYT